MKSIKPGRGSSLSAAIASAVMVVFGIFWTILAYEGTRGASGAIGIIFPLFGVLFVFIGLVQIGMNLYNAFGKKRMSVLDITSGKEEPDPLNERFGYTMEEEKPDTGAKDGKEGGFCPYCGTEVQDGFEFCAKCGRKLPW